MPLTNIMATNYLKAFATSPDANVLTDDQLASAEELNTGFKLRSKADSKLIGKLIQDTSAAAYAIGEFIVNNGGPNDVSGKNATQLAQDFDDVIKSLTSSAGGDYVTSDQLADYAPLVSPSFTGAVTASSFVGILQSVSAVTINDDSADCIEANGDVTVSDGSAGQCWTKVVHITSGAPNVQLGSNWHWQNGSNPVMKSGGFLVLCWCNTAGLAMYNNIS